MTVVGNVVAHGGIVVLYGAVAVNELGVVFVNPALPAVPTSHCPPS